jgi:hypothetical protein
LPDTYWPHYAEGSAMPPPLMRLVFDYLPRGPIPGVPRPLARIIAAKAQASFVQPRLSMHMDYWESELGLLGNRTRITGKPNSRGFRGSRARRPPRPTFK